LGDTPLLAWSIRVAQEVDEIDRVVVSTDCDEIANVAKQYNVLVALRPEELATDDALVIDAVRYHIRRWKKEGQPVDIVVLLEPTCPFRSAEDVQECLQPLLEAGCDSAATFTEAAVNPHRTWQIQEDSPRPFIDGAVPWTPRQALPNAYQLSGGAYAFYADRLPPNGLALLFGKMHAVVVPPKRSFDIDSEIDLHLANQLVDAEEHTV
jgi:N-acylneuraminate cytidylyltransferase